MITIDASKYELECLQDAIKFAMIHATPEYPATRVQFLKLQSAVDHALNAPLPFGNTDEENQAYRKSLKDLENFQNTLN